MKHSHFASLALGALAAGLVSTAVANQPTVISPPAVNNGSNFSRAPFPSARQFDDTKAPDGQAIDHPVSVVTAPGAIVVAQPAPVAVAPAPVAVSPAPVAVVITDSTLSPTGRSNVAVATTLNAATFAPTIRSTNMASRDQVLSDIEMRIASTEKAMDSYHSSVTQMSAEGRRQFDTAEKEVKEKAKALKKSLKAAQKANDASWDSARAQLASDYEAYAAALTRVDTAAGVTVVR